MSPAEREPGILYQSQTNIWGGKSIWETPAVPGLEFDKATDQKKQSTNSRTRLRCFIYYQITGHTELPLSQRKRRLSAPGHRSLNQSNLAVGKLTRDETAGEEPGHCIKSGLKSGAQTPQIYPGPNAACLIPSVTLGHYYTLSANQMWSCEFSVCYQTNTSHTHFSRCVIGHTHICLITFEDTWST